MVRVKQQQLGGITVLDKDGYSVVTASGARVANVANPINSQDAATKDYVDSLSIGNHAGSHQSGGSDQIDGYQLAIAYTPINYTAPSSNILGQHIRRIDNKLGTLGTGNFLANGTVSMTGNFNAGNNNIINVNLVDGYSIPNLSDEVAFIAGLLLNHSSRHESGGADPIDGYQLAISYSPTNYIAPTSNILGQHLRRIDDALAAIEGGGGEPSGNSQIQVSVTPSNGQTSFTLPHAPVYDGYVQMFVNGLKQQYGTDYSGLGTFITYTGSLELKTTDAVEFWYLTSIAIDGGGGGSAELPLTAQSVAGNPTGSTANAAPISLSTNTILGRAAGNVEGISIGTNTVFGRGSGNAGAISLAENTIIGRATGGNTTSVTPNDFVFANSTTSTKAGYNHVATVSTNNSATGTSTCTLTTDGLYLFTVTVLSSKVGGEKLISSYSFHATRTSGTLAGVELADPIDTIYNQEAGTASDTTAAVSFSNSSGNLLVSIANASGTTINSLVAVAYILHQYPTNPT